MQCVRGETSIRLVLNTPSTWPINLTHCVSSCAFSSCAKIERLLWCFWVCFGRKKTERSWAGCSSSTTELWGGDGCFKRSAWYPGTNAGNKIPAWPKDLRGTWNVCQMRGCKLQERCMELFYIYRDNVIAVVPAGACCSLSGTTNKFLFFCIKPVSM